MKSNYEFTGQACILMAGLLSLYAPIMLMLHLTTNFVWYLSIPGFGGVFMGIIGLSMLWQSFNYHNLQTSKKENHKKVK